MVEIIILNIAALLGMRNLILEVNNKQLEGLSEKGVIRGKRADFCTFEPIYPIAKKLGMNFFAGDPEHENGNKDIRNAAMSKYLCDGNFENGAI